MRPPGVLAVAVVMATASIAGVAETQTPSPLPAPDALHRPVRDTLIRAESVAYLYAFKERRTDVHTNPFGRIGTGGSRLFDVYPSSNRSLTYRRIVKRNGVPLPASELTQHDHTYRSCAAEIGWRHAA